MQRAEIGDILRIGSFSAFAYECTYIHLISKVDGIYLGQVLDMKYGFVRGPEDLRPTNKIIRVDPKRVEWTVIY